MMSTQKTESALGVISRHEEAAVRKRIEEKLAFAQEFNQLLVDSSGDCIFLLDASGRILSINRPGVNLLKLDSGESIPGRHWISLFPELQIRPALSPGTLPQTRCTYDASSRPGSCEVKYWKITFSPFGPAAGGRIVVVVRDVTEQMLAERALRQSEEAFRQIFKENPIGMLLASLDCGITRINEALSAMLGYREEELIGSDLRALPRCDESIQMPSLVPLLRGELRSIQCEMIFRTKNGQNVWTHVTTSLVRDAEGNPLCLLQMVENIQDRKSSEEQVLAYQEQLQSLASELALGEERERRRIATELHDRIGQSLAFARLKLAGMGNGSHGESLEEIRKLIDQAINDTRSLTVELSPPVLHELGLIAAIDWLTRRIQKDHGITIAFHDDGEPKPLEENCKVVLFHAVRELLLNVVKHARAGNARVSIRRKAGMVDISIEDDGIGFELEVVRARRESRSFGLFNVRERLVYLGGEITICSEPRHGTRVTLAAPVKLET